MKNRIKEDIMMYVDMFLSFMTCSAGAIVAWKLVNKIARRF